MTQSSAAFLASERRIVESGVREIFTPHMPVREGELLFGRRSEFEALVRQMSTPGQHSLVFGDRGVGKSSLVSVVANQVLNGRLADSVRAIGCDSRTTFEDILREALLIVDVDVRIHTKELSRSKTGELKGTLPFGSGSRGSAHVEREVLQAPSVLSPSWAADRLRDIKALLVVDEAEAAQVSALFHLAEFIKRLSDIGAAFKVVVVGVASTGSDLTESHPSVSRCLRESHLGPIADDDLAALIHNGVERVDLTIDQEAVDAVVATSMGFPHFVHLLALKTCEEAIATANRHITHDTVRRALRKAHLDAEATLRHAYDSAVRSQKPLYRDILNAGATLTSVSKREFSAHELRLRITKLTGESVSQAGLNNYLRRLVSDDGATVLTRTSKGVYRFSDPRMPSLVRVANALL